MTNKELIIEHILNKDANNYIQSIKLTNGVEIDFSDIVTDLLFQIEIEDNGEKKVNVGVMSNTSTNVQRALFINAHEQIKKVYMDILRNRDIKESINENFPNNKNLNLEEENNND